MPKDNTLEITEDKLGYFVQELKGHESAEKLYRCIQCGICSGSCPTARAWEVTPRQLVRMLQLGLKEEVLRTEVLYYCSQCYSCKVRCPMQIQLTELLMDLRRLAVRDGVGPLEEQEALLKSIRNYDNPWMQPRLARDRWAKRLRIKILPRERAKVLYYPGCTAAYVTSVQSVAVNTAKLLSHLGVDFGILGKEEVCCGSTALRIGERGLYEELAARNIEIFNRSGAQTIITACAGCYGIIKHEYPKVASFDAEILHLSEFLHRLMEEGRLELPELSIRVTYHDPCHLGRHGGVFDPPRGILKNIPGLELVEMERNRENSRCCGAGGGVRTAHSTFAQNLASERLEEAYATGAEALITCCPFCENNLNDALKARGYTLSILDLVDLLAKVFALG